MPATGLEIAIVAIAAAAFAVVGALYARGRVRVIGDFVSARGSLGFGLATATLVASVMGAWILFGPAESAVFFGMPAIIGYAIASAAPFVAFMVLGPRMRALMPEGQSLSDYVWFRYGPVMYGAALATMVLYMFVFLAAELTAIALAVNLVAGVPLWLTALVLGGATLAYTAYGGLRASIFTDGVQALFIVPLLVVALIAASAVMGGPGQILDGVSAAAPSLLDLGHQPGVEFAVAVIVAVLAANLFHQGYWQRVYACRSDEVLRRAFMWGAIAVLPIVFLAGLFGLMAVAAGVVETPSVALFSLALEMLPRWVILAVLVLAVTLVMSSMDTVLNGMVSIFTADARRLRPSSDPRSLLTAARWTTVVLGAVAILIASQGYSVLYLFLLADLVCAAAAVPVFAGMYMRRLGGAAAAVSLGAGLVSGALFFPAPDFGPWLPIPGSGSLMVSFLTALVVSSAGVAVLSRLGQQYDLGALRRQAEALKG